MSVVLCILASFCARAADGVQDIVRLPPEYRLEKPSDGLLVKEFEKIFNERAQIYAHSRLNPAQFVLREIRIASYDDVRKEASESLYKAIDRSVMTSAREIFAESALMSQIGDRLDVWRDLVRNSIGYTEEEDVEMLNASAHDVQKSWWKRIADDDGVQYGLRPLRTSPYVFAGFALKRDDELIALTHIRYYYRNLSSHEMEVAVAAPFLCGLLLDVGFSYKSVPETEGERASIAVSLRRYLGRNSTTEIYASFVADKETSFLVCIVGKW